jgi:molecular chaperone DnaK
MLRTVETVLPASHDLVLKVPIVQGEFGFAHLCRLIGTLEITGSALTASLPAGSEVEVALELDRGGQLRAQARIVAANQIFRDVALLVTPQASPETLDAALTKLRARAADLSRAAFQGGAGQSAGRLSLILTQLDASQQTIAAAHGGDPDALEQARRQLLDLDAQLAEIEAERAWPELAQRIDKEFSMAIGWLARFGDDAERATLSKAQEAAKRAFVGRDAEEVERQLLLINQLSNAAYLRHPDAWEFEFDFYAARVSESTDIRQAAKLVENGRAALRRRDIPALRGIVYELSRLHPIDRQKRDLGHGSGVRAR